MNGKTPNTISSKWTSRQSGTAWLSTSKLSLPRAILRKTWRWFLPSSPIEMIRTTALWPSAVVAPWQRPFWFNGVKSARFGCEDVYATSLAVEPFGYSAPLFDAFWPYISETTGEDHLLFAGFLEGRVVPTP